MLIDDQSRTIAAAVDGDRAAMDRLLRAHYDRMFGVCRRITGNDADAADATQEAMISVVRGIAKFDGRSSFGTWVYRIATNASLDELRRRRRRAPPRDQFADDLGDHDRRLADPETGPRLESVTDKIVIDAALAQLPTEFRVPIVLRDIADLDYAEIAATLDIPIGTVKSRIARGRSALAGLLAGGATSSGNRDDTDERPTTEP